MNIKWLIGAISVGLFISCENVKEAQTVSNSYPSVFPDYTFTAIPYNIAHVDQLLFRQQVERTGAFRLIVRCNLFPVVPYGERTLVFRPFVVQVHTDTRAVLDEDAVLAVLDVFTEPVVQEPLEIDDL